MRVHRFRRRFFKRSAECLEPAPLFKARIAFPDLWRDLLFRELRAPGRGVAGGHDKSMIMGSIMNVGFCVLNATACARRAVNQSFS